jgi:hypothetical protein
MISYAAEYAKGKINIKDVLALLSMVPVPDAIIWLDNGIDLALQRYAEREKMSGCRPGVFITRAGYVSGNEICQCIFDVFPDGNRLRINWAHEI